MNKVLLVGRLTKDPEKKSTPQGTAVTQFTVAVQRRYKNADGGYDADFISCVAWRKTAEFIAQYFSKGDGIGVVGSLQTRSYDDKNGNKRYVTEVVVDEAEFSGSKGGEKSERPQKQADEDFGEVVPIDDGELPF